MAEHSATDLGTTYDCKEYGCPNPARSRVGRYSYCDEHRELRAAKAKDALSTSKAKDAPSTNGSANGKTHSTFGARIKELDRAAKNADKARAAAVTATKKALDAKNQADEKEREFRALARDLMGD